VAVLAVVLLTLGLGAAPASADWQPPSMGRASYYVAQGVHVVGGPFAMRGSAVLLADRLTRQGRHVMVLTMSPRPPISQQLLRCYGVIHVGELRLTGLHRADAVRYTVRFKGGKIGTREPYSIVRTWC
jgi:hypothetical protein